VRWSRDINELKRMLHAASTLTLPTVGILS
jgi:hypothetical protein